MTLAQQKVVHQELRIEKDTKITTTRYLEKRTKMKKEKVVIVSGYFDPLHVGHLEYLQMASQLGDKLLVIVNNDEQAKLKKGESFMSERDRMEIIYALECVDEVLISCDTDLSVCKSIELAVQFKPMADLIFAKGGDRNFGEVPEVDVCKKLGIEMVDNLGEKIRSSSEYTGLKQI
jgi:cytidyltransferase-like protein